MGNLPFIVWLRIFLFFLTLVISIAFLVRAFMNMENGKCPNPNCGEKIKKTNLFCPWCHADLRGGGKN